MSLWFVLPVVEDLLSFICILCPGSPGEEVVDPLDSMFRLGSARRHPRLPVPLNQLSVLVLDVVIRSLLINFTPLFCSALESSVLFPVASLTEHTDQIWTQLETRRSATPLAQQGILLGRPQDEIQASHQALTRLSQQLTVITQRVDQIQGRSVGGSCRSGTRF